MVDFYTRLLNESDLSFCDLLEIKEKNYTMDVKKVELEKIVDQLSKLKVFIIFLMIQSRKINSLSKTYLNSLEKDLYEEFLQKIKLYVDKIPKTDVPACDQVSSIVTILYCLSEEAIFQNNLKLLINLSKVYKFEHTHLRLAQACGHKTLLPVLIEHYNYGYDLVEFNLKSKFNQTYA